MAIESINPATEEVLATFDEFTPEQTDRALGDSMAAFQSWRKTPFSERAQLMKSAARVLRKNKAHYAGLITAEMGKPITEAEGEIEKCAWNCEFYADNAERFLAAETMPSNATESYVQYVPLGPVLAVMPWNFPFWQVIRAAAPVLMGGNTMVLKHASNIPQCALAMEECFREAGFPHGVFQTVLVSGSKTDKIIEDDRIRAVTLTGSEYTGSKVAEAAGRSIKKCVLELGGSDPFIVLADADIQAAATVAARARNQNTGQSCVAAKRFIVDEKIADQFERLFTEAVAQLKIGDPTQRDVQVGPVARGDLRDDLEDQVQRTIKEGAQVLIGGSRPEGKGYYYEPTILKDVTPEMTAFREETFGPVAAVIRVHGADEAIELANQSPYGLGSNLWTTNIENAKAMAKDIESGMVFINGMVASDPRIPFGGVKRSGYGRELSIFGIREFVNVQTVWIGPAV